MRGDKLIIEAHHRSAAEAVKAHVGAAYADHPKPLIVSIGGESGSGKSELGRALVDVFEATERHVLLLQQDDYFRLPPKSNDRKRRQEITWVGMGEVRLDLLDQHLDALRRGAREITKPLIDYEADEILEETLAAAGAEIVIAEGTYTATLENVDCRVFIDRTYIQTEASRRRRARDAQDTFIERVLEIEHGIISKQISRADILVTADYSVVTAAREST